MAFAYPPQTAVPSAAGPSSRVELHVSCKGLVNKDTFSKSDPLVTLSSSATKGGGWQEFCRTEWIKNNVNPEFSRALELEFRFEEVQRLRFAVYDLDNDTSSLADDDFLGSLECTLGEIVSAGTYTKPLAGGKMGTITIRAEEVSQGQSLLEMKLSGTSLDKKDLIGKSDPYLDFSRENSDGSFSSVHRTEVLKNTLNPSWPKFSLSSRVLCNNNPSRHIKVKCFDWDSDGSHDLIGEFTTTLEEIARAAETGTRLDWELINPAKKAKKKSYKNSGVIHLDSVKVRRVYSFLDYIMAGCQINFTVGVDFTASNGDPAKPTSLHYLDPLRPNQYMQALHAVGSICQDYDTDKLFPALGFGGNISGVVSHEFALNGNPQNPYCLGIGGVMEAYKQALQNVKLWGPTNAAPIINHVARFAEQAAAQPNAQNYFVLLILTDGELSDMNDTKRAIIRASRLPMSVIIVGVGGANFGAMDELDSDDRLLKVGSEKAERDIVQFVPFRKFKDASPAALAGAVLAEVPQQLTEYMTNRGLAPLAAQVAGP